MKKIKKLIFICLIFLLSGCTVEYNLKISEDNSVSETVVATEKTKRMESMTRQKGEQAVSYIYEMFKRDDDSSITSREDNKNTIATVTKVHNNIEEYAEDFTSDVFEKVDVTKKDGIVTFVAEQSKELDKNASSSLLYDEIEVKIKVPYKVNENNADQIQGNTYIWKIKEGEESKTIKLVYQENSQKDKINIKINNKTYNINYGLIIGIVAVAIIMLIYIVVLIKNRKNNVV